MRADDHYAFDSRLRTLYDGYRLFECPVYANDELTLRAMIQGNKGEPDA